MDRYIEQIARRRKSSLESLAYMFLTAAMYAFGFFAILDLTGSIGFDASGKFALDWINLIWTLVLAGLTVLIYLYKDRLIVEYDYTLTNNELDVSSVFNQKKRKYLTNINLNSVTQCGPAAGPAFKRAASQPEIRIHRWFVNRNEPLYYFVYEKGGQRHLTLLELNDEMLGAIRGGRELQKGVWYDAEGKSSMYAGLS